MDKDLLRQVYGKYSKEIYAYLYTLCRNRSLAEDLLQETFLKAILSLPNTHENVRAWLYKVARNLYFNYAKRSARELPEYAEPGDTENAAEDAVLSKLREQALYGALMKLDGVKREVIMLQYFSALADRNYGDVSAEAAANSQYLENIMVQFGFVPYSGEWWHYSDSTSYDVITE